MSTSNRDEGVTGAAPPERPHVHRSRVGTVLALSGLLWLAAGLLVLFGGPGYSSGTATSSDLTILLSLPIGAMLLELALLRALRGRRRKDLLSPAAAPRPRRRGRGTALLGLSVLFAVLVVLLTYGLVPGWYSSPSGSLRQAISGCGSTLPGAILTPTFPGGFPPGNEVHLRWATANDTNVRVAVAEAAVGSYRTAWSASEIGSSGELSFVGSGGELSFAADAESECAHAELVDIDWTYSFSL